VVAFGLTVGLGTPAAAAPGVDELARCGRCSAEAVRWTARTTPTPGSSPGQFRLYGGGLPSLFLVGEVPAVPDRATYRQPLPGAFADLNVFQLRFVDEHGHEHVLATLLCPGPAMGDPPAQGVGASPGQHGVAGAEAVGATPHERPGREAAVRSTRFWSRDPLKPPPEPGVGARA
jgi:hypothetical protein